METTQWHESSTGNHQGLVLSETGENIAVTYDKANAQLIAAAPDLLAALKSAAMALDLAGLIPGDDYWQQQCRHASRDARSALVKATGNPA